jgi:hypothetical protein
MEFVRESSLGLAFWEYLYLELISGSIQHFSEVLLPMRDVDGFNARKTKSTAS